MRKPRNASVRRTGVPPKPDVRNTVQGPGDARSGEPQRPSSETPVGDDQVAQRLSLNPAPLPPLEKKLRASAPASSRARPSLSTRGARVRARTRPRAPRCSLTSAPAASASPPAPGDPPCLPAGANSLSAAGRTVEAAPAAAGQCRGRAPRRGSGGRGEREATRPEPRRCGRQRASPTPGAAAGPAPGAGRGWVTALLAAAARPQAVRVAAFTHAPPAQRRSRAGFLWSTGRGVRFSKFDCDGNLTC